MTAFAEIPTREAAESFADYARRFPEFEPLFDRIESAGYPLGVEGRLRAFVVLSRLNLLGAPLADAQELADYLVPVLASSAHEQASVRDAITQWAAPPQAEPGAADRPIDAVKRAAPAAASTLERADRTGRFLAAGLVGLALAALAALIIFTVVTGRAPDPGAATRTVVTYSEPIVSLDVGLAPFWRDKLDDALSRLAFAAVVLILGLSFAAWRHEVKGRLIRQTDETDLVKAFRFRVAIPGWFRTADARAAFDRLKRVRLFATDKIDVPRTIARSTRAGGLPLIVARRQRDLPTYVLLVDRAKETDLAGVFARTVEEALIDARIVYTRYDYYGGLDRLNPVRGGADADIVDTEYLPFSVIGSRHAGERLIVIGTGRGFFEVPGFRHERDGSRTLVRAGTPLPDTIHLREFSATFLITPAPASAWGGHEACLRDLGFEVLSADVGGVATLAARLMGEAAAGGAPAPTRADEDRFIARLDRDAVRLSGKLPPPEKERERLIRNLKVWSGRRDVYTLLAAIAAFPKIDTAFTFVLADMFLDGGMDSAIFARLVRLPWIRKGYMPDWLRIALVNGLDPEQRELVKRAQTTILGGATKAPAAGEAPEDGKAENDGERLRKQPVADFEIARQLPRDRLQALISRMTPDKVLSADERIFYSVLHDYRLDPEQEAIAPEAPEIIADAIDAPERARRAKLRAAVIALAAIAGLLQPWIWTGLTMLGKSADDLIRSVSEVPIFKIFDSSTVHGTTGLLLIAAMTLWFVNVTRDDPIAFPSLRRQFLLRTRLYLDARAPAFYALAFATFGLFAGQRAAPGASDPAFALSLILFLAAAVIFPWVSNVAAEQWWNPQSADHMVEMQRARDPLAGMLGALVVVCVWAVPWMLIIFPVLNTSNASLTQSLLVSCVGAMSWAASSALARRWLLGRAATGALHRVWMDAGFAVIVCLLAMACMRSVQASTWAIIIGLIPAQVIYAVQTKATLGLRKSLQPVWPSLINAGVVAICANMVLFIALAVLSPMQIYSLVPSTLISGLAYGAFTAFQSRRSTYPVGKSTPPHGKRALFGAVLVCATTAVGYWLGLVVTPYLGFLGGPLTILYGFVVPASLVVWPMFRVLTRPSPAADAPPLWRAIVDSPWWAAPAMWLVALVWHVGVSPFAIWPLAPDLARSSTIFSLWPLALPIAIFYWRRHGRLALVPLLVGTLPFIIQLGDRDQTLYTPGGVWPAIAILLLARFAADADFRARVLRRERLSWSEALLIVALLSAHLVLELGNIEVANVLEGQGGQPLRVGAIPVLLHIDPAPMLIAVAFVIGSSRMPITPFASIVAAVWILGMFSAFRSGRPWAVDFGVSQGLLFGILLVLYGTRIWRGYAASRIDAPSEITLADLRALTLAQKKPRRGIWLACAAALALAIDLSRAFPAFSADVDAQRVILDTTAVLALVWLSGLIAADLWRTGIKLPSGGYFRDAYVPMLTALIYILVAAVFRRGGLGSAIGIEFAEIATPPFGAIGVAVCAIGYFTFGVAARIAAEPPEVKARIFPAFLLRRASADGEPASDREPVSSLQGDMSSTAPDTAEHVTPATSAASAPPSPAAEPSPPMASEAPHAAARPEAAEEESPDDAGEAAVSTRPRGTRTKRAVPRRKK